MAYPFTYFPTLEELTNTLTSKYQVQQKKLAVSLNTGGNQPVKTDYFIRDLGHKKVLYPVPDLKPKDRLTPDVLRSLLSALEIPPKDFGFILD